MINQISDKIVFSGLKLIKYGKLNVTTFQNKKLQFGNECNLEASKLHSFPNCNFLFWKVVTFSLPYFINFKPEKTILSEI